MTTARVNLRNNAITQYGSFPFTSFCVFNGRPMGAGPDGIFTLDGGEGKDVYTASTDEKNVSAWFEIPFTQLGSDKIKQGRRMYVGGEFNGSITIKAETTGGLVREETYVVTPKYTNNTQQTIQVPMNSKQKSEYWGFTVANTRGSDFSIDFIDLISVNVVRRLGL